MKNLGYTNGWIKEPDIVKECHDMGHPKIFRELSKSLTEVSCPECGYYYKIDSSD